MDKTFVNLDPEDKNGVREEARRRRVSFTELVRRAVRDFRLREVITAKPALERHCHKRPESGEAATPLRGSCASEGSGKPGREVPLDSAILISTSTALVGKVPYRLRRVRLAAGVLPAAPEHLRLPTDRPLRVWVP